MSKKRQNGQFFTEGNPFKHRAFRDWARLCGLPDITILEPFAGANKLIDHLADMELCNESVSFDISPADNRVGYRDTLRDFPSEFDVCITNPPWLARNSATVRGLRFPECGYDDLYKHTLEKCLDNCGWVAALVPESFIRAGLFQERLSDFVSLTSNLFTDTGHPVGMALFQPAPLEDVKVWSGHSKIGWLSDMESLRPNPKQNGQEILFNIPDGNVGLIALDNIREASIRFCDVMELADYKVKKTGRPITKLLVSGNINIPVWNDYLSWFREQTKDVLMTCYKGIRKDGKYRRRLDWNLARGIVHNA
jgi:hypothetical protein